MWAGVNYLSDVRRARRLGRRVAELFISYGETDGHTNTGFAYPRPEGEQYWEATPPGFEDPPIGGPVGTWKPWVLSSQSQARIESGILGPFAYGSNVFMAELDEVFDIQASLTDAQKQIAVFWDDGLGTSTPAGHWNEIAMDLVRQDGTGTRQTARLFSYLNAAELDAAISYFEAKYFWWSIRPVTVARRLCDNATRLCSNAELDADPSLATYPDWLSYIATPPFPSYPSGHSTFSGAAGAVLAHFFPTQESFVNGLANEAALSRLYGGIHFRSDNDDGLVLGRYISDQVLVRAQSDGSGP